MPKPTEIASAAPPGPIPAERYLAVRKATEGLCASLSAEDQTVQPWEWVSPPKWHLAHTTWFFETMVLGRFLPGHKPYDPDFAFLFNSYYEALGRRAGKGRRGAYSRPTVAEVLRYRRSVDEAMAELLDSGSGPGMDPELRSLAELGLQHEQQHQELLLCDIKSILHQNPSMPAYRTAPEPGNRTASRPEGGSPGSSASDGRSASGEWVRLEAGLRRIGWEGSGFAFDNERPGHTVHLGECLIARRPVSNAEFAAFIAGGGYQRPELWLSDGWAAALREGWTAPLYWQRGDLPGRSGNPGGSFPGCAGWLEYGWQGLLPLEADRPVRHVSYYEADAFARWRNARLPTEAEWEAAYGSLEGRGCNWEWTASAYLPYPGFRPFPGALSEYNGKFMIDQMVLRGGSEATPAGHLRATYRNFFPASTRWQFAGIRLARDP